MMIKFKKILNYASHYLFLIPMVLSLSSVTAWAALTKTEVSQLYVAIIGRASEGEGNRYWQSLNYDMATTAGFMLDTDAAKKYFGGSLDTHQAFIEHIYLNTLNKTLSDDPEGIAYWVSQLEQGNSRGYVAATLVGVIKDYAPDGPYYNPNDTATVAAYNQFVNRVEVSNYMADTVEQPPANWETSTAFNSGLIVTSDPNSIDAAKVLVAAMIEVTKSKIPDTGQTTSYTDIFGEDSDYSINPPSYTKLDFNGTDLPDSATEWAMIRDNVTGLIWENKTDDGGIHDKDNLYTWYDPNPETNGGNAGTPGNGSDTQDFIDALNAVKFGGFQDWRLPTVKELSSILSEDRCAPSINTAYFQNTTLYNYWSSTTSVGDTDCAFFVSFQGYGAHYYQMFRYDNKRDGSNRVRAVRGTASVHGALIDNGDGTVSDMETGLMWQQGEAGVMTWEAALTYCENLILGGYDDWRLPNRNELQSLVEYSRYAPAIDRTYFPNIQSGYYSSTSALGYVQVDDSALTVDFGTGEVYKSIKESYSTSGWNPTSYMGQNVRAVRIVGSSANVSPTATIMRPATGSTYTAGICVSFEGSGTDPDGAITSYNWNFGDGSTSATQNPIHTYSAAGSYTVTLTVVDYNGATGTKSMSLTITGAYDPPDGPATTTTGKIPDTGQILSYTDTFGEDSDYSINPSSYTKLDSNGNDLPDSATEWAMIRDNVTGLIWENKTDDGGIHDKDNVYTWYDPNPTTNGGNAGTPGDGTDTQDFIDALNASNFGGYHDWRLPAAKELSLIVNANQNGPAINTAYFPFPNTLFQYWSSTTFARNKDYAWFVSFSIGDVSGGNKSDSRYYVRAVRGVAAHGDLIDNGDGTVSDMETGLMWQQDEAGAMTWEAAITYCENLILGGYDDWRLPNRNELQSLVDYSRYNPAIDITYFPEATSLSSDYWSSTTHDSYTGDTWNVHFYEGMVGFGYGCFTNCYGKDSTYYVRAVRGGESPANVRPTVSIMRPATGSTYTSGTIVSFEGSGTDADGTIASYNWNFGDGATSTAQNHSHTFNTAGSYTVTLTVTDDDGVTGTTSISLTITGGDDPDGPPTTTTLKIPDTGQITSYTNIWGEDSDYIINPPSYTKLDENGADLPDSAASWAMIRDNVTGLIWENKTDDGGIHDKDNTYTWYDPNPATNGGNAGTPGNGTDTQDFIDALNAAKFGGFQDWRLPRVKELSWIVNANRDSPAINTAYFQNTMSLSYWSSTTYAGSTVDAWCVGFSYGGVGNGYKPTSFYVRAVRGGE